jgi:hypothetical protein
MPQQKNDFFKIRVLGEIVYVKTLIDKHAVDAVDIANGGAGRDDAF